MKCSLMKINTLHKITFVCLAITFLFSCNSQKENENPDKTKEEIIKAEKEFEAAAKNKGIAEAFYSFADENAVIKREHDTLIKGNENIKSYYQNPAYKNADVSWTPDFTDVSADGNMGYTY